ncbi:MAG: AraC family transcriptional regulator [Spirochaetes bacterium]|nr:AraC family transcriptional regulator [Spirochaetota bacterium]
MISLEAFINHFIYFAGGVSLLVSAGELFVRRRRLENYIFFALLSCFGALMFQIGFIAQRLVLQDPRLLCLHTTFLYLVGPIGYFAYFLIILPRDTLPPRLALYLLPALGALAFDAWCMAMPAAAQAGFIRTLIYDGELSMHPGARLIFAAAGAQICLYLGALFTRFLVMWVRGSRAAVLAVSLFYLLYTIVASSMTVAGYVVASPRLITWGGFMMALLFISAFLVSQRFPRFLQLIIDETEKKYRSRSLIAGLDVEALIARLGECMADRKMFMNDDLTLKDLADELAITVHQLSQILNERLATNFNTFVNQYRINESKALLLNEPERSVISIAYAVGFNTKSSFYYAFSRFTGTTPQDFRRENL